MRVETTLREKGEAFAVDAEFLKLKKFYDEMKEQGIVQKQDYSLPPLDTIGMCFGQSEIDCTSKTVEEISVGAQ
jgi:hypothetical protein